MSDDNIFREVDEDLRREEMLKLWDKYGVFALIGAACIVLGVGAYKGYTWWEAKRMAENGTTYQNAIALAADNNAEALSALKGFAKDAPAGYQMLADLQVAALEAKEGKKQEAVAQYDAVANGAGDAILRDFAKVQAAALRLDDADYAEISHRLDGLNTDNNPWRHSARELLGLAAFRSGNTAESEKLFSQILADPSAPDEIRKRAQVMLALLLKAPAAGNNGPKDAAATQ